MTDESDKHISVPYELSEFARKWNIPSANARVILEQKGPSRINCDAEAQRYKKSVNKNLGKGF
jgi:hypothetical protein